MIDSLATVASTSPLTVRLDGTDVAVAGKVLGRGDSFSPALGARVAVALLHGDTYVLGLA